MNILGVILVLAFSIGIGSLGVCGALGLVLFGMSRQRALGPPAPEERTGMPGGIVETLAV